MSTAGRDQASATEATDVAGALERAEFVRLVARADGDGLAAAGILARALTERDTPFQTTVSRPFEDATRTTDADVTVAVGTANEAGDLALTGEPVTRAAVEVVRELGNAPSSVLAMAGATVACEGAVSRVEAVLPEGTERERRPGVAVPVADLTDGLVHSTLFHAPFSGETAAVEEALADVDIPDELDEDAHRRVASLVALAIAGDETANDRATDAIERALRPSVGGPFETIGGYGDVLDAVARERPGLGIALALGHESVREDALDVWRTRASRAHTGIRTATTSRYDGLFVLRETGIPVDTVARLVTRYRSPEPVTLVVTDGGAVARTTDARDVASAMDAATTAVDGAATAIGEAATGSATRARTQFDVDPTEFVSAFREAL